MADHIFHQRFQTVSLSHDSSRQEIHINPQGKNLAELRKISHSDALIFVTEFHNEGAQLLLNKLNCNTEDRYNLLSGRFRDDYLALYYYSKKWRLLKQFTIWPINSDSPNESENSEPQSFKVLGAILRNQNGQKLLIVALHFRRIKKAFQKKRLMQLKKKLNKKLEK